MKKYIYLLLTILLMILGILSSNKTIDPKNIALSNIEVSNDFIKFDADLIDSYSKIREVKVDYKDHNLYLIFLKTNLFSQNKIKREFKFKNSYGKIDQILISDEKNNEIVKAWEGTDNLF